MAPDWSLKETYNETIAIAQEHSGAYSVGVDYAYTMVEKADKRSSYMGETLSPDPASLLK